MTKKPTMNSDGSDDATGDLRPGALHDSGSEFSGFMTPKYFSFDTPRKGEGPTIDIVTPDAWTSPRRPKVSRGAALTIPIFSNRADPWHKLPPGLCIVSGPTMAGKTRFLSALASDVALLRLQVCEPFDTPESVSSVVDFDNADSALVAAIVAQRRDPTLIPAIDSLRSVLFEMQGSATSKGMTARFFTQLTRVSNGLAAAGHTVLATINPMNPEADFVREFLDRLSAATSCLITIRSTSGGAEVPALVTGDVRQRPLRNAEQFEYRPSAKTGPQPDVEVFTFPVAAPDYAVSPSSIKALSE